MPLPSAQLSCQECQRRKTKCDKRLPACSACIKADSTCTIVQRPRLPRGRTSKKVPHRKELRARIERLEAVLSTLSHETQEPPETQLERTGSSRPALDSFVASEFWEELSETIIGMREVLETPDAGEEPNFEDVVVVTPGSYTPSNLHSPLFPITSRAPSVSKPDLEDERFLFEIYQKRVHPIFRVLHWPSTSAFLEKLDRHGHDRSEAFDARALRAAICFTAMCSLRDHEITERPMRLNHHRITAEDALVRAEMLTTSSLITLQAFVVYLAGLRACQANAQQWTLTALAVRIANAQGISGQPRSHPSPLENQMKRRLWCCIGVLDMQSAFDRGSNPLLASTDLSQSSLPFNCNDEDLLSATPMTLSPEDRFTDMSFSILAFRAGFCQRRLTELGRSAASGALDAAQAGHAQLAALADFEHHVRTLSSWCDSPPSDIQAFTLAVGEESVVAMKLLLHRPLHHQSRTPYPIPSVESQKFDVLGTATEVLERSRYKRGEIRFARWAWFAWVKWYALAVVLAELCATVRHAAAEERAWSIAQWAYEDYAGAVADAKSGLLWKPIAKLMRKVREFRAKDPGDGELFSEATNEKASGSTAPALCEAEAVMAPGLWLSDSGGDSSLTAAGPTEMSFNSEEMPWSYWDTLIEDLDDPDLFFGEDLPTGFEAFDPRD